MFEHLNKVGHLCALDFSADQCISYIFHHLLKKYLQAMTSPYVLLARMQALRPDPWQDDDDESQLRSVASLNALDEESQFQSYATNGDKSDISSKLPCNIYDLHDDEQESQLS